MLNQIRSNEDHQNPIEQGFTLVELLIVIVILGILAGIVVFAVGNLSSNAKTNACATEKSTISTAPRPTRPTWVPTPRRRLPVARRTSPWTCSTATSPLPAWARC